MIACELVRIHSRLFEQKLVQCAYMCSYTYIYIYGTKTAQKFMILHAFIQLGIAVDLLNRCLREDTHVICVYMCVCVYI